MDRLKELEREITYLNIDYRKANNQQKDEISKEILKKFHEQMKIENEILKKAGF